MGASWQRLVIGAQALAMSSRGLLSALPEENIFLLGPEGMLAMILTVLRREKSQCPHRLAVARCLGQPHSEKNYNPESILTVLKLRPREEYTLAQDHTMS